MTEPQVPEPLAANQASRDASAHYALKHAPEDAAVSEALIARMRECRMIRDPVLNREPAKPAIGQVHGHLTAERPLRADAEHIANDEHPDH